MCHESLHDPMRTLPCQHSACVACLDQLISHRKSLISQLLQSSKTFLYHLATAPLKCPVCQAFFDLPETSDSSAPTPSVVVSTSSLPVNLFASSALVTVATSSNSSTKVMNPNEIKCEICEDGEEEDATSFCVPCTSVPGVKELTKSHVCQLGMSLCLWTRH